LNIDLHTHGKLAKKLPFSEKYTDWLLHEAKASGLDAICLTEHFNTQGFVELYRYIDSVCRREGDALNFEGLRIFAGMETDIAEGGHILSIGPLEAVLELNQRLIPNRQKESFLPLEKLLDIFSEYPLLSGAGHPFRAPGHIPELADETLKRLGFIELNGKDATQDPERIDRFTYELGERLGVPVAGGSDTHQATQYGCVRTCFEKDCTTVEALIQEVRAGRYRVDTLPDAAFRVRAAGMIKRALKQVHALGGDYVSTLCDEQDA
jgi:hypothetical protein